MTFFLEKRFGNDKVFPNASRAKNKIRNLTETEILAGRPHAILKPSKEALTKHEEVRIWT